MKELLQKIRDLLQSGWCREYFAMDKDGFEVFVNDPKACKWCLLGAINRICGEDTVIYSRIYGYIHYNLNRVAFTHQSIPGFNDGRTQEQVIAFLDELIEKTT